MGRPIYEACYSGGRSQLEILDHLFEVRFEDPDTHVVLRHARFFVTGDAPLQAFLAAHPQWQRGCWPFGLFALKEWMWQIKFIDVQGRKRVLEGGLDDPQRGRVLIRAELEIFSGPEGWMLPLFNLANSHVPDQLHAFYGNLPSAAPTGERIEQVLAEEQVRRERARRKHEREQQERASIVPPQSGRSWVFMDESGDPGFNDVLSLYVFSAVLVPADSVEAVRQDLRTVLQRWRQHPPREIHLAAVPDGLRDAVIADLAAVIVRHNLRLIAFFVPKWPFIKNLLRRHAEAKRADDNPLALPWEEYLRNPAYHFRFNFLSVMMQEVVSHLSLDFALRGSAGDFRHDRKHVRWMNAALEHGFTTGLQLAAHDADVLFGRNIVPTSTFGIADSHAEPCLWLADWVSWEMRNWGTNRDFELSPAFRSAQGNMLFVSYDDDGVKCVGREPGGHADHWLPDFPREFPMETAETVPTGAPIA